MPDALAGALDAAAARLIGRPVGQEDRFGLAVSGGADSMAMLRAASTIWPGQIEAATVDHGLRPEAKDEAALVARWCAEAGIVHAVLRPDLPITGNLQSAARSARYRLLEAWRQARGLDWLLTAHHADDQIETVIMRLNRGSGVGGLAGVRARQGRIIRPLLGVRRADLRVSCMMNRIPFVDDPSNEDPRFDRARLRAALADRDIIEPGGLARSVEALADADAALDWVAGKLAADHVVPVADGLVLERTDLPGELLRRLLLRIIALVHPEADLPRGPSLDQALVQLFGGKTVTLADCIVSGGRSWTVRRAPPRRRSL